MSKFWTVFKREYAQVVKKKSFVVGLLLMPLLMSVFTLLPAFLASRGASSTENIAIIDQTGEGYGAEMVERFKKYTLEDSVTPYFNVALLKEIPSDDQAGFDELTTKLNSQINDDALKYYLVIGQGVEAVDTAAYLVSNAQSFSSISRIEYNLGQIISEKRLEASSINLPVDSVMSLTSGIDLPMKTAKGESVSFLVKWGASMIFVMMIYGMVIAYSQLVMRSIIEEKNSRIIEVLVSSLSPFQLMLGKILGLGAATLTQIAIWAALGGVLYLASGAFAFNIDPAIASIAFNPMVLVFFALFMIFGYLLFSSIFALLGSIVNTEKEAQSFVAPIIMVLILPMIIGMSIIQEPNSTMAVVLSMIPFFTPTLMMMRVVFLAPGMTHYSLFSGILGEATLAFILLAITTVVMIWVSGRIFRIGILMYGKRPTLPELIKWFRRR